MKTKVKIVLDANLIGSILLGGKTREQFITLVRNYNIDFYYCENVISEVKYLSDVPFFKDRKITEQIIQQFLIYYQSFAIKFWVTSFVKVSRDKKDNYLLSLCRDAKIDFLLTGDKDLLTIKQYTKTQIITLREFLELNAL